MPIMTKMRDNMPAILIGLVIVFLITIVFEWGMDYLGIKYTRSDTVGIIGGKKIKYQEFSDLVKRQADQYKQQTKQEPDDNTYRQIRDQVWNSLVTQVLLDKETERSGITVTNQEIVDWVRGPNPPEFLVQQFKDSTGQFRRDAYEQALADPRNKEVWIQVETVLKQQRLAEKMQSVVLSSVRATPGEVEQRYADQNIKINVQYALFDPSKYIAENTIAVTDDDIKKVYTENPEEFKAQAMRRLKYVIFSDQPSARDSEDVRNEINGVLQQAKSGIDFLELQKTYSETTPSNTFFKHGELTQAKEEAVFDGKVGQVVGPVGDNDGLSIIKILEEKRGADIFVKARHILLSAATPQKESESVLLAKELISRIRKGEDFSALAKQYSTEPGASTSGGELGWFGKGRMVKQFEDAAMKGRPGEIIGPLKTQFGIHVIKIEGRDNRELKLASITFPLKPSAQTRDAAYQRAQDFAYVAKKGSYEKEAEGFGLPVRETADFPKGGMVPGLGFLEIVNKFAFKNSLGEVSEPFQVNGGYAICKISDVKKEGMRPFDEVKEMLKPRALLKKKMVQLKTIVSQKRAAIGESGDLAALTANDPNVVVQTTGDFSIGGMIPSIGRDYGFIGAAHSATIGKISEPVEGVRGYYLLKLLSKTPLDSVSFAVQKNMIAAQIVQEKKQRILNDWLEKLKENASIEDNRDTFFR